VKVAMFYSRNPSERDALAEQHVSIIGCGSFGSALADMLVRAGLGRLTLIDPELLETENLGRHVLTGVNVGQPKAAALAARLLEINPNLQVDARQERFQDGSGLLVCCADSRRCESLVNAVSLEKRLPAVFIGAYGAVRAAEVQICVPGETACRECFAQWRPMNRAAPASSRYTDPDFDETRTPGQRGLWGSILAVGGIAFHAILALLKIRGELDLSCPVWIVNLDYEGFQPFAVTQAKVRKGCPVCDDAKVSELQLDDLPLTSAAPRHFPDIAGRTTELSNPQRTPDDASSVSGGRTNHPQGPENAAPSFAPRVRPGVY
jgi:molybdopterin/thiamine biosynthesis adenylyltransferase